MISWSGGGSRADSPTTVPMTSRETVSSTARAATTVPMTSRETAFSTAGTASPDSTSLDVPRRVQQFNLAARIVQPVLLWFPAERSFHLSPPTSLNQLVCPSRLHSWYHPNGEGKSKQHSLSSSGPFALIQATNGKMLQPT